MKILIRNLDRVTTEEELKALFQEFGAVQSCSLVMDRDSGASKGFGFVIVEAMVKSKPVVAFDISSNPEIIAADKTGFLVDHLDLEMFAEKTSLLIQDQRLREKMGAAARQSVYDRFSLVDRVSEIESYLNNEKLKH